VDHELSGRAGREALRLVRQASTTSAVSAGSAGLGAAALRGLGAGLGAAGASVASAGAASAGASGFRRCCLARPRGRLGSRWCFGCFGGCCLSRCFGWRCCLGRCLDDCGYLGWCRDNLCHLGGCISLGCVSLGLGRCCLRNFGLVVGGLTATLGVSLGLGLGLLLRRGDDHDHVSAVLLRSGLNHSEFQNVLRQTLKKSTPEFGAGLLTSAEHDRDLDLVAAAEEALDVAFFRLIVMRIDLGPELHLFDDGVGLVPACLACLQSALVLELAEVHELAHRRTGVRGNLDQVEIGFLRESECVLNADDTDLFAVRSDKSDLWYADPVIDPGLDADVAS
jgi:hypothetical protein